MHSPYWNLDDALGSVRATVAYPGDRKFEYASPNLKLKVVDRIERDPQYAGKALRLGSPSVVRWV
jgi:hypothetical protein